MCKRLAIWPLLFSAALAACAPMASLPPSPAAVAERTVLDEKAALSVELAYQASALSLRAAIRSGLVDPQEAASIDATAFAAVGAVRTAYDAGNATDYAAALVGAREAVAAAIALAKGDRK